MPWWGWLIVGATLFGAELMIVDLEFYLVFLGLSAIIVGLSDLAGISMAPWLQWLVFAALSISSMVLFRQRVYKKLRGSAPGYAGSFSGETLTLSEDLAPGASCRMEYHGSTWTVRNVGTVGLTSGQEVTVQSTKGLTLNVGPLTPQA